jgi:hypothetical protein
MDNQIIPGIVNNGCSGKCCENFTLPFTPTDLINNNIAVDEGRSFFIKENGQKMNTTNNSDYEFYTVEVFATKYKDIVDSYIEKANRVFAKRLKFYNSLEFYGEEEYSKSERVRYNKCENNFPRNYYYSEIEER